MADLQFCPSVWLYFVLFMQILHEPFVPFPGRKYKLRIMVCHGDDRVQDAKGITEGSSSSRIGTLRVT